MIRSEAFDVSIILPVRNAEKILANAFEGIYAQKGVRFEVIVIDGNSIDDTALVVKKWFRYDDIYIIQSGKGIYDAMNAGISRASGRWIYIQGADDCLFHDNVIANMLKSAGSKTLLIFGNVHYTQISSRWVKDLHISSFDRQLLLRNSLHQQSVLYHRNCFEKNKFDTSFNILGDYAFHLKLFFSEMVSKDSVVYINSCVAKCSATGISKKFNMNLYLEEWRVRRTALPFWLFLLTLPIPLMKFLLKSRH